MIRFAEREMTDGDRIELERLTCKVAALRAIVAHRQAIGEKPRHLAAALDAAKSELRYLTARYR